MSNILDEAKALVDGDRQASYGSPKDCLGKTAKIFEMIENKDLSLREVAMFNVAQKLARLSTHYKRDTVIDICGYLHILADHIMEGK